jgi:predicted nuclease with TOPRIM domain
LKEENERVKAMMKALQDKLASTLLGKSQLSEKADGTSSQVEELRKKLHEIQDERDKTVELCENLRKEA